VAAFGPNPDRALGDSLAVGSGCSPGTDSLPGGVWFGWVTDSTTARIEFDLACLWPGRIKAAAGNDALQIRTISAAASERALPDIGYLQEVGEF
jgi:hypothetical protein